MSRLARAALPAIALAACADAPPPAPARPAIVAAAPPPASAEPAPSAALEAPKKQRPPPRACAPRPAHAPPGYVYVRGEQRGPHGTGTFAGPRFTTGEAALAPSLKDVQATIDKYLDTETKGALGCKQGCSVSATCEVTRNDGTFLSVACVHEFSYEEWRSGVDRQAFLWRREGDRFAPIKVQALAREPDKSFLFRLLPSWDPDTEKPLADEQDLAGFYVALRADAFELGTSLPFDPMPRVFRPYERTAHHLTCDALLDMPKGPAPGAEGGAIAVASRVIEAEDPVVAAQWLAPLEGVEYPRFVALDPRQAAAAQTLDDLVDAFLAAVKQRAKRESWAEIGAYCRAYTSTSRMVSVLCYGGGNVGEDTRTARESITLRLGDPAVQITGADLFAQKPAAPAEIAKRCLGHLVRKPKDKGDETLTALPKLSARDLGAFAVGQMGFVFAVEYTLAGKRRLTPCYVPNEVLGTSLEMLSLPARGAKR